MLSVSFLNIICDVIRAAWCSFVSRGGFGEQQTAQDFEFIAPGAKDWNDQLKPSLVPPSCKWLLHLLQLPVFSAPSRPCLVPEEAIAHRAAQVCSPTFVQRLLRSEMFSAHKSSRWRELLRAEGGTWRLQRRPHHLQWKRMLLTLPRKLMERP